MREVGWIWMSEAMKGKALASSQAAIVPRESFCRKIRWAPVLPNSKGSQLIISIPVLGVTFGQKLRATAFLRQLGLNMRSIVILQFFPRIVPSSLNILVITLGDVEVVVEIP